MEAFKFYDIEQNSDEWFEMRCGKFTASTFKKLLMKETTVGFQDAIAAVTNERVTGETEDDNGFSGGWMQRGSDLEPEARERYEALNFVHVSNGGFWCNDWIGASPDGMVGDNGGLEIKCPKHSTHLKWLTAGVLPPEHFYQVHGQLLVTDREWFDFYSYHPDYPDFILRVNRSPQVDKKLISALEYGIQKVELNMNFLKKLA